ncbi:hypothetical protein TNCV_3932971 [Trichonephila clavipes]|nr:hypothetical protein TNCV_3932971 [Trichonephila clavipes]
MSLITAATRRDIDSKSFWIHFMEITCQILSKAVHDSMNAHPISQYPTGTSERDSCITGKLHYVRLTEHHKRMEEITHQLYVPNYIEGGWYTHHRSQTVPRKNIQDHDSATMQLYYSNL